MTKRLRRLQPLTRAEVDRLVDIRLHEGWSFRQLGDHIGLKESTVQNILRGEVEKPVETTVYRIREWLKTYVPTPKAVSA